MSARAGPDRRRLGPPPREEEESTSVGLSPFSNRRGKAADPRPSQPSQGPAEKFGILQPQEVILGLFGEYVGLDERAWSGGLVQLLGELGFSAAASRVALNRVIARGLLAPVKEGRFVFYTITPRLKVVCDEGRHQMYSETADVAWNRRWTLVWYAIPEEQRLQRARLGRWLNLRGFGALQDGTWIAAGDCDAEVLALAERLGLRQHVIVFNGELGRGLEPVELVARGWRIADLTRMYDAFVAEFAPLAAAGRAARLPPAQAFMTRTRLIEMFRQTIIQDPRLPDEVLGIAWNRRQTIELFQALQDILLPAATQHFRDVAVTGAQD